MYLYLDMVPGYNEMGMRGSFPPGMRGMRVPQQPGGYQSMGTSGGTSPGVHQAQGYPPGQYPQQRHPGQQFMDPIRAQVCEFKLIWKLLVSQQICEESNCGQ